MSKKVNIKYFVLLAGILLGSRLFAQYNGKDDLDRAVNNWNEFGKNKADLARLDSAKFNIEKAFVDENVRKIGSANNIRGAIYKEIYKAREIADYKSPSRKMAVECFLNSYNVDTTARNRDIVKQQLKWVAVQYNNDTKKALESAGDFNAAEENFAIFKKLIVICEPNYDIASRELEFELAVATSYLDKANTTNKKEFIDLAKVSCFKVLDRDSLNGDANFKLATVYYNQGANIILKTMTLDCPIDSIPIYEDMANKLFKQALPFMERAYRVKPKCLKILEGFSGIYYSLNDEENFKKYKALFDKLKEELEKGLVREDCN